MNHDNPAARLYAILENARLSKKDENCRGVWARVLGVNTDVAVMSRLGKAMHLPHESAAILQKEHPEMIEATNFWSSKVCAAFMVQNMHGPWSSFNDHIDSHTMSYLLMSAKLIQAASTAKLLAQSELESYRDQINELQDDIAASDLPETVKVELFRALGKILLAIDEYFLTGAVPILDSIESTVGHAARDPEYRAFLFDSELGKRALDTLSAMANAVTVSVGVPQLSAVILQLTGS